MSDCPNSAPLGNLITVLSGFPFPSAQFTEGIGKPLIRIRDLVDSRTETNFVGDFDPAFLIRRDDVLIGMDGDFNVVRWEGPEALLNQRVCKVSSASDEIDQRFLFWWLKPHIQIVHRRTPQTTVRHLSVGDVYRIPKPTLVSKAQAFAAAVLDTVDEAIAKTEAVIAKLRQVRAGLLHDLLTRGLDDHGQLRDPIAHPEHFQDSPLGRIPKEWRASPLGRECPLQRGFDITVSEQRNGDVPVVSSSGVNSFHDTAMVQGPGVVTGRKGKLGEVFYLESSFWPHDTSLWVTDFHGNLPIFIALLLQSMRLERFDAATSVPTLNRNTVHPLFARIPPSHEQEEIVRRVAESDDALTKEESMHRKLGLLKSGLMTDLLTGRVRVQHKK